MRYPITPEYLAGVPEPMVKIYQDLEDSILEYICEQFKTGDANEKSLELIRLLRKRGLSLREIEKRIKRTLGLTQRELDRVYSGAIKAIRKQTEGEFANITRSLGFALRGSDGKVTVSSIQETYTKILNDAVMQVQSGAFGSEEAIRKAIERLADSGLQWVDYESGWHNRIDVAARRAVMTAVSQLSGKYSEALIEETGAEFAEISAHRGARDHGVGPKNHKSWQGKVYHIGGAITYEGIHYEDFVKTTGYGTGEGLNGWNCRHKFYPFIPEIMERTYTDDELAKIDPPPFKFEGREYTAYEATQKQRAIESAMRNVQRRMAGFKAAGDTEAYTLAKARYQRLRQEYIAFSKAADLPTQLQRAKIYDT